MDDTLVCPLCGNKLRNTKEVADYLFPLKKFGEWMERVCTGPNHVIQFFTDLKTGQVDFLKISLNPKYSRFMEIDYINQRCRVITLKNNKPEYIDIPKMIEPDFPDLIKLKERVSMYVVFS